MSSDITLAGDVLEVVEENNEFFLQYVAHKDVRVRIPVSDGKIVLPTASTPVFRQSVAVYATKTMKDGRHALQMHPEFLQTVGDWILHMADRAWVAPFIRRAVAKQDKSQMETLLRSIMLNALNTMCKADPAWEEPASNFSTFVQSNTYLLVGDKLPFMSGWTGPDLETVRRLKFFELLMNKGLTRYAATQPGDPGTTADRVDRHGYPACIRIQPLAHMCSVKRFPTARGLSHLLNIEGAGVPPVKVKGAKALLPPMATFNVACTDMHLNDGVIISEKAASRLVSYQDIIHKHTLDGLITCRGGVRFIGRKGYPIKKHQAKKLATRRPQSERKATKRSKSCVEVRTKLRQKWLAKFGSEASGYADARAKFDGSELEWQSIPRDSDLWGGDYSPKQSHSWNAWLLEQKTYTNARNYWSFMEQPVIRRF